MSTNSLAALRKTPSDDLQKLANQHLQHDLTEDDRAALQSAASRISTHATVGSALGLGMGLALAVLLRRNRVRVFEAFRTSERPVAVRFGDGREEAIPDIAPLLAPTRLGDIVTYTFFSIAGLFLGGETGLLTGASSAKRTITGDPERRMRIERAFRAFRADILRKEIEELEKGAGEGKKEDVWLGM